MWTDNPSERAEAGAFRRQWVRKARGKAWESARRFGLWIGALVGAVVGVTEAVLSEGVNIAALFLAIAIGALAVLLGTFILALFWWAPARLAWEAAHEYDPDSDSAFGWQINEAGGINPSILYFVTRRTEGTIGWPFIGFIPDGHQIRRVRLVEPEEKTFELEDLPVTLRVGRWPKRGRVIIKEMSPAGGFLVEFIKTHGVMCRAEVYFSRLETPIRPD